jgi:acyl-CoA thioesterase FadM
VMHTEFYAPAVLDEKLKVITYFSRIGHTSLQINFVVMGENGVLHAAAYQVLVCVSRKGFSKVPVPPDVIRAIEPFTMEAEVARKV